MLESLTEDSLQSICKQLEFVAKQLRDRATAIDETVKVLRELKNTPPAPEVTVRRVLKDETKWYVHLNAAVDLYFETLRKANATMFNTRQLATFVDSTLGAGARPDNWRSRMTMRLTYLQSQGIVKKVTAAVGRSMPASWKLTDED